MKHVLIALIRLYRCTLSLVFGPCCRFHPSCSQYGMEALHAHGAVRGSWLTLRRVLRCHPWNPGGYDPVPPPRPAAERKTEDGRRKDRTLSRLKSCWSSL